MKGRNKQLTREHNDRMFMAWHIAALPRYKKFPPLKKLLIRDRRPQSPEQMLAVAKQWTMLLGGSVTGKPN